VRHVALTAAALAAAVSAQVLREHATGLRASWPSEATVPYAPSPAAARYVSLGYRELAADLMWMRILAYLGGSTDTADGIEALVEGTLALDPHFKRAYDGGLAIESATHGVDTDAHLAALAVLDRAMATFPDEWKFPYLAGQIYVGELFFSAPERKPEWTERGIMMLERAVRMPGTPAGAAALASHLHQTLGRHEAAIKVLEDKIVLVNEPAAKRLLLDKLAALKQTDAAVLAIAMLDERDASRRDWLASRPQLPFVTYLLLGKARDPYAAPEDLAVERDLIGTDVKEPVEPLVDPEPAPEPDPEPAPAQP
jgi:hypothetical protein